MQEKGSKQQPLILVFSTREETRSILMAGLLQCNFQVIEADTAYNAGIKAGQYIPDLVVMDIAEKNLKDFLLVERLSKSLRTRTIPVLISVTPAVRKRFDKTFADRKQAGEASIDSTIQMLEYPYQFAALLKKIQSILFHKHKPGQGEREEPAPLNVDVAERLFDSQVSVVKKLQEIENVLQKQWAFPHTVIRALDIVDATDTCCDELGKCIETDLAAAAAILRVANTVYYAKRGKRVSNVTEAVVRLGFRETRNLLSCLALIDLSPEAQSQYGFSRKDFWLHSLATGIIAEKLSTDCGHRRPELAFVAGLIHDIGKIPLDNNFRNVFPKLLEKTTSRGVAFHEVERSLMGFSHCELGHHLTFQWNFPQSIALTLLHHHDATAIGKIGVPADRVLQGSVFVANILAKAIGMGHSCDQVLNDVPARMLKELKITTGPKYAFLEQMYRRLRLFCDYLNLPKQDIMLSRSWSEVPDSCDVNVVFGPSITFHPVVLALQNAGFRLRVSRTFSQGMEKGGGVTIFIPDEASPLEVTLHASDVSSEDKPASLRIFLLNRPVPAHSPSDFEKSRILLLDRQNLDLRVVLHALDRHLERVTIPEQARMEDGPRQKEGE